MPEARPETMREALTRAIAGCAAPGSLHERAASLFAVLGYESERTGEAYSAAEFLELYDGDGPRLPDGPRTLLLDAWRTAGIVFQVTSEEIDVTQTNLFKHQGFEPGRIESFLFLAVEMMGDDYDRTRLAEMTRTVNRIFSMPVVVLFRHGSALTLAMIHRRTHKRDKDRDVLERVTLVKGIHVHEPNRAHIEILADLELSRLVGTGVRSFDELHAAWERILDIEALNRRFYSELFSWFHRAVRECRFPDDGAGDGNAQRHVIRLITRLLFIWFLKEKGLVPDELFDEDFARTALKKHAPDRSDYYRAVIQNLFFATLNTEIGRRAFRPDTGPARRGKNPAYRDFSKYRYRGLLTDPDGFVRKLKSVPFVNGGLFDCLDEFPGGRRIDAFTDHLAQGKDLHVPTRLFFDAEDGLFPLFRNYKFTVEENTPLDREVALDPELLGRVFENLLAAYNPETRETARKSTGSYYTPRHIVDYMVDEALVASLAQNVRPADDDAAQLRDRLRYLLDYERAFDDAGELFDPDEKEAVVRAIAELRVLDPAVGSGAFPMGMLHKLTLALKRLDPRNRLWEELQKEHARRKTGAAFDARDRKEREDELLEISDTFEAYRDSDFGRKLYLIQNGIFGVDVQPIACQIAKLRFFISLVIEQQPTGDPRDNYGIRPLPNLETRFVAANTLIGLGRGEQRILGNDVIKGLEDRLRRVRERYFHARTRQIKRRLREQDDAHRNSLSQELERLEFDHDHARAVADWNPYDQNASASWFDTQWMFSLSEGFDVVIGNPPYIRGEKVPDKAGLRTQFGPFYTGAADIYTYFFRRSVDFLKAKGLLCFITSNKFMRAGYGEPLRTFLVQDAPPLSVFDFGQTGTFDATVRPSVLLAQKAGAHNTLRAATMRGKEGTTEPAKYMEENGFPMDVTALSKTGWALVRPSLLRLRDKIEPQGVPLREYQAGKIYRGILTGANDAFVLDEDTRNRLIDEDPASDDLIRPWLQGRDVRRWYVNPTNSYAITIASSANRSWPWSDMESEYEAALVFQDNYPAIHEYLFMSEDRLRQRQDKGVFFWELRSCSYYEVFGQPKIIYPIIGKKMRALLDRKNHLANDKCFIIPVDDAYLLALLNSKVLDLYFRLAMPCLDDPFDGGDMEFRGAFMERVPIAPANTATKKRLSRLAEKIQTAKERDPKADTETLEQEIDEIVYRLYRLTEKERKLIDSLK